MCRAWPKVSIVIGMWDWVVETSYSYKGRKV